MGHEWPDGDPVSRKGYTAEGRRWSKGRKSGIAHGAHYRGGGYDSGFGQTGRLVAARLREIAEAINVPVKQLAIEVANRAIPVLDADMLGKFDSGITAYGDPRPLGSHGNALDLVDTEKTRNGLHFTNDGGTKLRVSLPEDYDAYLIGKYEIIPRGGQRPPPEWQRLIGQVADGVVAEFYGGAG